MLSNGPNEYSMLFFNKNQANSDFKPGNCVQMSWISFTFWMW